MSNLQTTSKILNCLPKHPVLLLYVDSQETELKKWYTEQIQKHNTNIYTDPFPNAGFDIATHVDHHILSKDAYKIDLKIKAVMGEGDNNAIGYYLYPRSSIAKTPLMMANHVGIIDSGYRGNLISAFRNLDNQPYKVEAYSRMVQICHPSLKPFFVFMVDSDNELGKTVRGDGGFGSTGV